MAKGFGPCETVKVDDGNGGYKIINKSDMTDKDKVYEEKTEKKSPGRPKKEESEEVAE